MTGGDVERLLCWLEERNNGWVCARDLSGYRFHVFVDDRHVDWVEAVNRSEGRAVVFYHPIRLSDDKSEALTYEVFGEVRMEQIHD